MIGKKKSIRSEKALFLCKEHVGDAWVSGKYGGCSRKSTSALSTLDSRRFLYFILKFNQIIDVPIIEFDVFFPLEILKKNDLSFLRVDWVSLSNSTIGRIIYQPFEKSPNFSSFVFPLFSISIVLLSFSSGCLLIAIEGLCKLN